MDESDAAAVQRAREGDTDAFRALVDRHSRRVFNVAYRMTSNEHDAEEVVQNAFLKAYENLAQFDGRARFGTWLYRIAVNCAHDVMRRRQRHHRRRLDEDPRQAPAYLDVPTSDPDPARLAHSSEIQEAIASSMDRLSEQERAAFVLRHFEGMSIREIGRVMGTGDSATKNAIFRGVQKLREDLEPLMQAEAGS